MNVVRHQCICQGVLILEKVHRLALCYLAGIFNIFRKAYFIGETSYVYFDLMVVV